MHLIIAYHDGRREEAIVLSASRDRLRISIPGGDDTIELSMDRDAWITETGERVEIESLIRTEEWRTELPTTEVFVRGAAGSVS
ncbi:MAG TPA: hypothetical protein VKT49_25855 [Bryobacteraceae bacterium]|nr:hypothetical protein [Bryobacteraceae bacterium]